MSKKRKQNKMNRRLKEGQRLGQNGVALIAVYLVIVLLIILAGTFFARTTITERVATERERDALSSLYVAEAGADAGILWLRNPGNFPNLPQAQPAQGGVVELSAQPPLPLVTLGNHQARVWVYGLGGVRYIVFSLGSAEGTLKQVVKEVRLEESFAKWSYFSDDERYLVWRVWFMSRCFLEGPVHTNTAYPDPNNPNLTYGFHISGDPTFDGPVSSVGNSIYYMHGGPPRDNPDFQEGIELGVEAVPSNRPLDQVLNANRLRNGATGGGLTLQGDTTVELLANGTMNVTNVDRGWTQQNMSLPANEALFVDNGDLTISGTLNGRLTAGSSGDIVIPNNLVYNTDPVAVPSSNDMMGLISENNVIIPQSAPHDVTINATITATGVGTAAAGDGSFVVENWWVGPPKGILRVYGGVIQIARGPVGTFNPWTDRIQSGYEKDYHYDPRCRYNPPSWFPVTGEYDILSSTAI